MWVWDKAKADSSAEREARACAHKRGHRQGFECEENRRQGRGVLVRQGAHSLRVVVTRSLGTAMVLAH